MFTFKPFFADNLYSNAHPHGYSEKSLSWKGEKKQNKTEQNKKKQKKKTGPPSQWQCAKGGEWPLRDKLLVRRRQAGWGWGVLAWAAVLSDSHFWLLLQFDVNHWVHLVKQHHWWICKFHFSIFCSVIWLQSQPWTFSLFRKLKGSCYKVTKILINKVMKPWRE